MVRLVCIDVDGTLVGTGGTVLAATWAAAERARAAGIHLAICSGRPAFGLARGYAERLDPAGWHVFQNGASIVQLAERRSLSTSLPRELVDHLIGRARVTGWTLELYTDTEYAVECTDARARAHADLLGVPFRPRAFDTLDDPIVRAQWLMPVELESTALAEEIPGLEMTPSTSPVMPDTSFINMTAAGVNKARAVRVIAAELAVTLAETMFVGDGRNDLEAMREVGWAIAMGNAEPELHDIARHVVSHVDDAGLAEALGLAMDARAAVAPER
ncbi:MAG: Cof-type HAD-IIB family hydrolase [Gemmatimonadaceae bacterium]|nr:Cof-type HAD-IIB family hydrolase [Gemmatimonadaceae bacterium]NUQ94720.1 Cof-type HAD-IIB family hydrolase [Gemmatimonadaceae bacterium]NUR19184.1 Cof-type HAD-IIB family hydrolase [Gemmatimonadaceae bacterium]NUS96539.1 Cof-type HAD-IIB family hydrolase [Gemmatimonadaceae bacterium]